MTRQKQVMLTPEEEERREIETRELARAKIEADRIREFRERVFISDDESKTDIPRFVHGKWAYQRNHRCSTCELLNA